MQATALRKGYTVAVLRGSGMLTRDEALSHILPKYKRVEETALGGARRKHCFDLVLLVLSVTTSGSLWLLIAEAIPKVRRNNRTAS